MNNRSPSRRSNKGGRSGKAGGMNKHAKGCRCDLCNEGRREEEKASSKREQSSSWAGRRRERSRVRSKDYHRKRSRTSNWKYRRPNFRDRDHSGKSRGRTRSKDRAHQRHERKRQSRSRSRLSREDRYDRHSEDKRNDEDRRDRRNLSRDQSSRSRTKIDNRASVKSDSKEEAKFHEANAKDKSSPSHNPGHTSAEEKPSSSSRKEQLAEPNPQNRRSSPRASKERREPRSATSTSRELEESKLPQHPPALPDLEEQKEPDLVIKEEVGLDTEAARNNFEASLLEDLESSYPRPSCESRDFDSVPGQQMQFNEQPEEPAWALKEESPSDSLVLAPIPYRDSGVGSSAGASAVAGLGQQTQNLASGLLGIKEEFDSEDQSRPLHPSLGGSGRASDEMQQPPILTCSASHQDQQENLIQPKTELQEEILRNRSNSPQRYLSESQMAGSLPEPTLAADFSRLQGTDREPTSETRLQPKLQPTRLKEEEEAPNQASYLGSFAALNPASERAEEQASFPEHEDANEASELVKAQASTPPETSPSRSLMKAKKGTFYSELSSDSENGFRKLCIHKGISAVLDQELSDAQKKLTRKESKFLRGIKEQSFKMEMLRLEIEKDKLRKKWKRGSSKCFDCLLGNQMFVKNCWFKTILEQQRAAARESESEQKKHWKKMKKGARSKKPRRTSSGSSERPDERQKPLFKKDPGKLIPTPFIIFRSMHHRKGMSGDVASIILGKQWRKMSQEQKQKYHDIYEQRKADLLVKQNYQMGHHQKTSK